MRTAHSATLISNINPALRGQSVSSLGQLIVLITTCGAIYGAVMGTSAGMRDSHWLQILYSAMKVPMLLGITFVLAVPSYFILNSLAGLREDFVDAMRAIAAAQAGLAITLASLSPFTALWYASSTDYHNAVLFNGLMFALSTTAGQVLIRRQYRPLIKRNHRHRILLRVWSIVFSFVAIQLAYVLRPFIGNPDMPTHFVRSDTWGNAYVIVAQMLWDHLKR